MLDSTRSADKHAYLIIAHHQFALLGRLLHLLDHDRHDIYIHVDKKARGFEADVLRTSVKRSSLHFIDRTNVNWGGSSLIRCELDLLRAAVGQGYAYYHLLSGTDLPLRSVAEILDFFDRNQGLEFIEFADGEAEEVARRVDVHHLLQEYLGRPSSRSVRRAFRVLNRIVLSGQRKLGINRLRSLRMPLRYGSNWFSITDNLARFVLDNVSMIRRSFYHSRCADELFLQTLVCASPFRNNLAANVLDGCSGNLRAIDWRRAGSESSPYVWRSEDFDTLIASGCLFARKFDLEVDASIVDKLTKYVSQRDLGREQ